MSYTKSKDKYYENVEAGPWIGKIPIKMAEEQVPIHRWRGKKMSAAFWNEILSFFEWSLRETKSETQVHLFYHDDEGWRALVMPQEGHTGMTTKMLGEHENWGPTIARLGDNWGIRSKETGLMTGVPMGTVHHHCGSQAFQSGVDHADELKKEGIHITVGHIGSQRYSIHVRANFNQELLDNAILSDWFELDPVVKNVVPKELHEQLLHYQITKPPEVELFPTWWKANVIKIIRVPTTTNNSTWNGWNSGSQQSGKRQRWGIDWQTERDIKALCSGYSYSYDVLLKMLDEMKVEPYASFLKIAKDNRESLADLIRITQNLEDEEQEELLKIEENLDKSEKATETTPTLSEQLDEMYM